MIWLLWENLGWVVLSALLGVVTTLLRMIRQVTMATLQPYVMPGVATGEGAPGRWYPVNDPDGLTDPDGPEAITDDGT